MILDGLAQAIGNTPLIKIKSLSALKGCNILGKAKFMNPGGSVKDRVALLMIREAESKGSLMKNGTVVEGTAGNSSIGLAHVCDNKGWDCIIYRLDNQFEEKIRLLKTFGAEVRVVPTIP